MVLSGVVAYIAKELACRGHEVTLFASGDSTAKVPLRPGFPKALRLTGLDHMGPAYHLLMLSEIYDHAERFDVIHSHVDPGLSVLPPGKRSDGLNYASRGPHGGLRFH